MLPDEKEAEKNRKIILNLAAEIEILKDNIKQEVKEKYTIMKKYTELQQKYQELKEK